MEVFALLVGACLLIVGCSEPISDSKVAKLDPPTDTHPFDTDVVAKSAENETSFFTVEVYDANRDASDDLKTTTALASESSKRILIEVGGKW